MASRGYEFYCPHCEHRLTYRYDLDREGDPRLSCRKCGKTCIDPHCQEPALKPFQTSSKPSLAMFRLPILFFLFIAVIILIGRLAGIPLKINWTVVLIFAVLWVLLLGGAFLSHNRHERNDFEKWSQSHSRLQNPNYAYTLHMLHFKVPPYYLPTFEERIKTPVRTKLALLRRSTQE